MSEDIGDISPSQALAEIETIRRDFPFATEKYTPEVDARKRALYVRAYDPPEEGEAPKGRQFPEVLKSKPRREAPRRATASPSNLKDAVREWAEAEGIEPDDDALGMYPIKSYAEKWGSYQPSYHDERQWDKAVRTAAKIGVSPTQLGKLRDALLEDAPIDADGEGGDYSGDDYPPPVSIEDDSTWAIYKAAREIAARHSVSPAAFKELSSLVLAGNEVIGEPQMRRAQRAAVFDLIHNVGEDRAVGVVKAAQKAFDHFAPSGPAIDRLMATPVAGALVLGDHPIMIELLGNVGEAISFDALPREFRSPNGDYNPPKHRGNSVNRDTALSEIQRVERERRKVSLGSYEHREFTEELSALYKVAYPGNQGDDDDSRNGLGSLNRQRG